ncbi:MAG: hypothetical protein V4506_11815 [Bacteroidota bacterium]
MKYITILLLCLHFSGARAQGDSLVKQFDRKKQKLNHTGMIVLSSWAGANIAGSAIGYKLTNSYGEKQFYIMNGAWGLINLGIALPGVFAKPKESAGIYELQKSQTKMEKIFLANAVLDVAYITGGVYLKQYSYNQSDIKKQQQFNGYGNSVIIQGAGLFVFDTFMTLLNNRNRKKNLDPFLKNATVSFTGNYFRIGYRFN